MSTGKLKFPTSSKPVSPFKLVSDGRGEFDSGFENDYLNSSNHFQNSGYPPKRTTQKQSPQQGKGFQREQKYQTPSETKPRYKEKGQGNASPIKNSSSHPDFQSPEKSQRQKGGQNKNQFPRPASGSLNIDQQRSSPRQRNQYYDQKFKDYVPQSNKQIKPGAEQQPSPASPTMRNSAQTYVPPAATPTFQPQKQANQSPQSNKFNQYPKRNSPRKAPSQSKGGAPAISVLDDLL